MDTHIDFDNPHLVYILYCGISSIFVLFPNICVLFVDSAAGYKHLCKILYCLDLAWAKHPFFCHLLTFATPPRRQPLYHIPLICRL